MSPSTVPSRLNPEEFSRLLELLKLHYSFPLPIPLSGKYELLFAKAVQGVQEQRKLLFDVYHQGVGWSLKTFQTASQQFEVVIQRCDILSDASVALDDPEDKLGLKILERFYTFADISATEQRVSDPRAGFLLRDKQEKNFVFFQQSYERHAPSDVKWRWANDDRKSMMGFVNGTLTFRWYRSGTQLFGVYRVPEDAHHFQIDVTRASLEDAVRFFSSLPPSQE